MADFIGSSVKQPMSNPKCTMWVDWNSIRGVSGNKPGWYVTVNLYASRTPGYTTYGSGNTSNTVHNKSRTVPHGMIEITSTPKLLQSDSLFVDSEAGADIEVAGRSDIWMPEVVSGTVTYNVKLKRNVWTIRYNANGGNGIPASQKKHWGIITKLSTVRPSRVGHTFVNWNTRPDGSGEWYAPGQSFGVDNDVTFYAIWKKNTFTISFNANGGTVNNVSIYNKQVGYGDRLGDLPIPTRNNYKFLKWIDIRGNTVSSSRIITTSEIYTAVWELDSVMYIKVNDKWERATPYIKHNGKWKRATSYIKNNGKWKQGVG